jgi:hypothetical protein
MAELKWLTAASHGAKADMETFRLWKQRPPAPQTPEELEAKFWAITNAQAQAAGLQQGAK